MPLLLDIALTHILGRPRQTLVSVIGVALGVGFFIGLSSLMGGFQQYFISTIIDVSPHITISDEFRTPAPQPAVVAYPGGAVAVRSVKPREEKRGIKRGQAMAEALRRLPGVHVAPSLQGQVFLRYGSAERTATVVGIDPEAERQVSRIENDMVAGKLHDLQTKPDGVILGTSLAKRLGAGLNDTLTAVSPAGVVKRVTVVGLFRTGITSLDEGQGYMVLKQAQILQDRINRVNRIRLRLDDVDEAQALAARIEARFLYKSESWQEANQNIFNVFVVQNAIIFATVGAILIVASFGIFNVISTVIFEKQRDIAILKSLGFPDRDIRIIFLAQGLILGTIGAVLGWAVGYGIVTILAGIRLTLGGGAVQGDRFHLLYSLQPYLVGGIFALVSAGLAAWLPTRRATRLNPVDIIRGAA